MVSASLEGQPKTLARQTVAGHSDGMHLAHLRLRDLRNCTRLDVDFAPGFHLLLGDNAQGKTNILEAIYLIATLRSFRGVGGAQMVRHGQKGYFVGGKVVGQGEHDTKMYWSGRERSLSLDGQSVRKLTDYLGVLRTVVFCTREPLISIGADCLRFPSSLGMPACTMQAYWWRGRISGHSGAVHATSTCGTKRRPLPLG